MAKICPIMSAGLMGNYGNTLAGCEFRYCMEEDCALWIDREYNKPVIGRCGLK